MRQNIVFQIRKPMLKTVRDFEFPRKSYAPSNLDFSKTFKSCPDLLQPVDHPCYRITYRLKNLARQAFCRSVLIISGRPALLPAECKMSLFSKFPCFDILKRPSDFIQTLTDHNLTFVSLKLGHLYDLILFRLPKHDLS